uniref:Uncharacterized protein n=1 Tax=Ditylenchus dipsaci TaxID=166011 RepID=A0A915DWH9_9BILA
MLSKLAAQCDLWDPFQEEEEDVHPTVPVPSSPQTLLHFLDTPYIHLQTDHLSTIVESQTDLAGLADVNIHPMVYRHKARQMGTTQPMWFYRRRSLLSAQLRQQSQASSSTINNEVSDVGEEKPQPVLKRKRLERMAKKTDPLHDVDWLNISPRMALIEVVKEDLSSLLDRMKSNSATSNKDSSSVTTATSSNITSSSAENSASSSARASSSAASSSIVLVSPRNVSEQEKI